MFLFLDVASPIPEFHIINDKKVIDSTKIIDHTAEKLSDNIIPKYLKLKDNYQLGNNLSNLIITIGPGSYTALRVGASFIAGLSYSMNLPVSTISSQNLCKFLHKDINTGVYFQSSKNQSFFTYKKGSKYVNEKIDNSDYILPKNVLSVSYNHSIPKFTNHSIKIQSFSLVDVVLKNILYLEFKKNFNIKPIYISNNIILN